MNPGQVLPTKRRKETRKKNEREKKTWRRTPFYYPQGLHTRRWPVNLKLSQNIFRISVQTCTHISLILHIHNEKKPQLLRSFFHYPRIKTNLVCYLHIPYLFTRVIAEEIHKKKRRDTRVHVYPWTRDRSLVRGCATLSSPKTIFSEILRI